MKNKTLNHKDKQLLSVLKRDARISISSLARQLNISRTTAQQRLQKLEERGVIHSYTVKLAPELELNQIRAYVSLTVDPSGNASLVNSLEKMDEIQALFTVSGKIDFIAIIQVGSPAELDEVLDRIGRHSGVRSTESAISLTTKFDRR